MNKRSSDLQPPDFPGARLPDQADFSHRRRLPHWRLEGATYFLTWRLYPGQPDLSPVERDLVAQALRHFDGQRYDLFAYVVMSDHVHVLVRPKPPVELQSVTHSWKSFTYTAVSKSQSVVRSGKLWQDESFDRIVRSDAEFEEKLYYILNNPYRRWPDLKAYEWTWVHPELGLGDVRSPGPESRAGTEARHTEAGTEACPTVPSTCPTVLSAGAASKGAACPQPAARLGGVSAYSAKGRPWFIRLKLDANEGVAPPATALEPLHWREVPRLVQRYPTPNELEAFIAERYGVAAEQVLVTAGVDDALYRACQALLEPGREVVLSEPTFEMLPRYAALAGGAVRSIPWMSGEFPRRETLAAINPRTSLIVVVTPNNPTGLVATADDLLAISQASPDAVLICDLAYTEFADADLTHFALQLPNTIVMRTLSKAWGLAGLRVGYAVGPAHIIGWLRAAGNPFPTSGLSLLLARERLRAGWQTRGQTASAGQESPVLMREASAVIGGQASPVLVGQASPPAASRASLPDEPTASNRPYPPLAAALQSSIEQARHERTALSAQLTRHGWQVTPSQANFVLARSPRNRWLKDALWGMGIAIRAFPDRPGLTDAVRITCPGEPEAFARLQAAIETALAPQALLVDRSAVLRQPDVAIWRRLAEKLPLALLNERPRAERADTLSRRGLAELFGATLHEGDAPQSPEPAFLRLALQKLGVERAWVLSGRREEMIAARVGGLTPIGMATPTEALVDTGPARVVADPCEILEWLI